MHRLVQRATRTLLNAATPAWIASAVAAAEAAFPESDFQHWPSCERLALHARAALEALPDGTCLPAAARLALRCGQYLRKRAAFADAQVVLRRGLAIAEAGNAVEPYPGIAENIAALAALLRDTNRSAEAEPLLRRTIEIREAAYGVDHPSFAHALCDVAVLLHDTGRFAEAELLYGQALAIYEASYGADHPVVAACLNNVAELFADDGRVDEAELLYRRALASDEATYGPHHANVARDLNNLAGLLTAAERAPEARPLLDRALAIVSEQYEPDHPRVQIVRDNAAGGGRWRNIRRSPSRGLR
jgi:tetratricopeptide (TPR) repeat protein